MRRRSNLPCFVAIALVALCPAQNLDQKVTYRAPAARGKALVADLARATHLDLGVSTEVEPDVLLVSVKDVCARDLISQIARADHAEWIRRANALLLSRSASQQLADEANDRRQRADNWKAGLRAFLKNQASDAHRWDRKRLVETFTKSAAALKVEPNQRLTEYLQSLNWLSLVEEGPGGRAVDLIVSSIDPYAVADLRSCGKIVLATHPNAGQRPLGDAGSAALQDLARERALMIDVWAESGLPFADGVYPGKIGDGTVADLVVEISAKATFRIEYLDDSGRRLGQTVGGVNEWGIWDGHCVEDAQPKARVKPTEPVGLRSRHRARGLAKGPRFLGLR